MLADFDRKRLRARDIPTIIRRMTSEKKIDANRRNAKKSTGPKSSRGKSHARFNAHVHGLYSHEMILPGEDEDAYRILAIRTHAQTNPAGPIEELMVSQIVADIWRLRRLEQAERTYYDKTQTSRITRIIQSLSEREYKVLTHIYDPLTITVHTPKVGQHVVHGSDAALNGTGLGEPAFASDFTEEEREDLQAKLRGVEDLGATFLEAIVPADERHPMSEIERIRGKLVRDVLRNYTALGAIQERRLTLLAGPADLETEE